MYLSSNCVNQLSCKASFFNLNGILKEFPHAYGLLYITIVLHVINMWIFITHEHGIRHG